MDKLLVLIEPETGDADPALRALVEALAGSLAADFVVARTAAEVSDAILSNRHKGAVAVLSPGIERPLSLSRRIAKLQAGLHFVMLASPAREATLRREATFGAPPGGRWSILSAGEPLAPAVASALQASAQRSKLRTTLDNVAQRVAPRSSLDAGEIRRLVVSDRYLVSVLQHAHDAIVSLDGGGHIASWNGGAERMFGQPDVAVRGRAFVTFFEETGNFAGLLAAARSGHEARGEFTVPGAASLRVDAVFDRLADDSGGIAGYVVILRDITQQHRAQQTLVESNHQKDQFLAMLGHELRNPLAPIRNAARVISILSDGNPKAATAAAIIERQVTHMTRLVDDLLDVARVTRGIVTLDCEPVALADIVREAIEQVQPAIGDKAHTLIVDVADERLSVSGDRKRLVQVVTNLLGNSAKFTPAHGRIRISVLASDTDASIVVEDNGIGIDAALLPRVFDLFAQGERSADRALGGLGLGLALVKTIVRLHGGRVEADSEGEGRGSRFAIHLPKLLDSAALLPVEAMPTPASPAASGLSIMVVDDNADAAHTLATLLEAIGHRVHVEVDPRGALANAPLVRPDVFVLDIGMPHLDGYQLAVALCADARLGEPLLIALTGYGQPSDVERARAAGFDHHLIKPLDLGNLEALLARAQPLSQRLPI